MAFLGMRGTGDWVSGQDPQNWRQMILRKYPNGDATLTAILSMMESEPTDNPIFNWWDKDLPSQAGAVTDIFDDPTLGSATGTGVKPAGTILYVQVAQDLAEEFRAGQNAVISKLDTSTDENDHRYNTFGKIRQVQKNGASSFLAIELLVDSPSAVDISDADYVLGAGNSNPQGGEMPTAKARNPNLYTNYTHIWRDPMAMSRTARKMRLRTGDQYAEAVDDALEEHAFGIERSSFHSEKTLTIGDNGQPETTTQGFRSWLKEFAPEEHIDDYVRTSFYGTSTTWAAGGEDWINDRLERVYRHGSMEKLGLGGSLAMSALKKLAQNGADVTLTPGTVSYGIKVVEWVHQHGVLYLRTHPLFTQSGFHRRDLMVMEPRFFKTRILDDTRYYADPQDYINRNNRRDGVEEEWLSEFGYEWNFPEAHGILSNLGLDIP